MVLFVQMLVLMKVMYKMDMQHYSINSDKSAQNYSKNSKKTNKNIAVIISDTFGSPFRMGQTNCAIGISGINPILDYEGTKDTFGKTLRVTAIAVVDELCSAAELVMEKLKMSCCNYSKLFF